MTFAASRFLVENESAMALHVSLVKVKRDGGTDREATRASSYMHIVFARSSLAWFWSNANNVIGGSS